MLSDSGEPSQSTNAGKVSIVLNTVFVLVPRVDVLMFGRHDVPPRRLERLCKDPILYSIPRISWRFFL